MILLQGNAAPFTLKSRVAVRTFTLRLRKYLAIEKAIGAVLYPFVVCRNAQVSPAQR